MTTEQAHREWRAVTPPVLPDAQVVADAAAFYAANNGAPWFADADLFDHATAAAYRLASVYPIAGHAVEVHIAPQAVRHAVSEFGDLITADSIAESAATVLLDVAAERAGVPLSRGHIHVIAPGILRLTW